jgi:gliding motility-associated-like protein
MKEQNIEQLFKDGLSNLEADVNPNVWTNVEQGLRVPTPSNHLPGNSSVVKSAGYFSKMSINSALLYTAAAALVIGTAIYFTTKKPVAETTVTNAPVASVQSNSIVVPEQAASETKVIGSGTEKNSVAERNDPEIKTGGQPVSSVTKAADQQRIDATKKEVSLTPAAPALPVSSADVHSVKNGAALPEKVSSEKSSQSETPDLTAPQVQKDADYQNAQPDPKFDQIENYLVTENGAVKSIPNVFTPNGDGINDKFSIRTKNLKSLEVIIYDQSGKTIYAWKSLDGEWDGKLSNGAEAPQGNYRYSLLAETLDGKICIAGNLLILKRD